MERVWVVAESHGFDGGQSRLALSVGANGHNGLSASKARLGSSVADNSVFPSKLCLAGRKEAPRPLQSRLILAGRSLAKLPETNGNGGRV